MTGALNKIFHDFTKGDIDSRQVLYRLSLLDIIHGDDDEEFKKNLRIRRTIVTELLKHRKLPPEEKRLNLEILAQKYLREYLYWIVAAGADAGKPPFADYIRRIIQNHTIPHDQYEKIERRNEFWNLVEELERKIMSNSNLT